MRQTPTSTNYDTVTTAYSWNLTTPLVVSTSEPCPATLGGVCPTLVHTSAYDALGRLVSEATTSNETVSNTLTNQDVLSELSPAPAGENVKETQTEYDGLGRVTRVCHVQATGGSACGMATGGLSGIVDIYAYSQASGQISLSITRGSETRSFVYDALGRMIQKSTPEGGLWYYRYDSQTGCTSHPGKLICYSDPNGTTVTNTYDSLGRLIATASNSTTGNDSWYIGGQFDVLHVVDVENAYAAASPGGEAHIDPFSPFGLGAPLHGIEYLGSIIIPNGPRATFNCSAAGCY